MKHAPINNTASLHRQLQHSKITTTTQQDYTLEQIDFGCFSIVICDNTAALPCKRYCLQAPVNKHN